MTLTYTAHLRGGPFDGATRPRCSISDGMPIRLPYDVPSQPGVKPRKEVHIYTPAQRHADSDDWDYQWEGVE